MTEAAEPGHGAGWIVLHIPPPGRGEELLLIDALRRIGAHVVQREGEGYAAHFPADTPPLSLVRQVESAIRASTTLRDPEVRWRRASPGELEALWAGDVRPQRVTDRITVVPNTLDLSPEESGEIVIRLHPGIGFGTAQHPTTRSCLRMLQEHITPGVRLADVGSGSGILAIAAALLGADRVLALEADPHACRSARRNTELNQVGDRVKIRRLVVGPKELATLGPFDGIVANVEASTLTRLLPGFHAALSAEGWLILSGLFGDEPERLVGAARAHQLALRDSITEAGWWTGYFKSEEAAGNRSRPPESRILNPES